jgi:hypothetical protein
MVLWTTLRSILADRRVRDDDSQLEARFRLAA